MADDIPAAQRFQALALAKTLLDGGEPEPARIILQRCLPLFQAQQEPAPLVNVLGMLAACNARLMRFDEAESAYDRALRIANEELIPEHPVRVAIFCSWAAVERSRGELAREKHLWQLILPVLRPDSRFDGLLKECLRCLGELELKALHRRFCVQALALATFAVCLASAPLLYGGYPDAARVAAACIVALTAWCVSWRRPTIDAVQLVLELAALDRQVAAPARDTPAGVVIRGPWLANCPHSTDGRP